MEGKCNKAPNTGGNAFTDHVYSASTPNSDVLALLKENKQLKAMLILHLDLIQEQSDQLIAKDKALITQNEELETLRARNATLENHVQDLQKQLQRQIKRSGEVSTLPPPPLAKIQCKSANVPTSMAQSTKESNTISPTIGSSQGISNIIGEFNGKIISKIVLQRLPSARGNRTQSPQSQTTDSEHEEDDDEDEEDEEHDQYEEVEVDNDEEGIVDEEDVDEDRSTNVQEDVDNEEEQEHDDVEDTGREIEQSKTQSQVADELYDTGNSTEDSNEILAVQSKRLRLRQAAKQSLALPRGAKPSVSPASTTTNDGQMTFKAVTSSAASTTHLGVSAPTLSRGKQMNIMRWHNPDYHTDESVSCDSTAETEKRSTSVTSCSPPKPSTASNDKKRYHHSHDTQHSQPRPKIRRCTYISTPQLYSTREWEDEANCDPDSEAFKSESKILHAGSPKLEIPKWTEHELTPSYCIEGTEDLSDDIFFKRHAKLEVDEKRRKKWDVQQIREQRRIERLKRRHCKDEIQHAQESTSLQSFYPSTENLQTICFVHDLPVQAFGEMIPKITTESNGDRKDFLLPWLDKLQLQNSKDNNKKPTVTTVREATSSISSQTQHQMLNSSFVLKKRKRQSSTFGHHTSRQRSLTAKLAAAPIPPSASTVTTASSSTVVVTQSTTPATQITNICNNSSSNIRT